MYLFPQFSDFFSRIGDMKKSGHSKIEWNKFLINSSNKFAQLNWDVFKCLAKSKCVSNLDSAFIVTYSVCTDAD